MWDSREIEDHTEKSLAKRSRTRGKEQFARYLMARTCLVEEILPQIKAVLPNMTDHGPDHVSNVLDNALTLIQPSLAEWSPTELYCLILTILFHDTGNIFDRSEHQRQVAVIYDYVRQGPANDASEKFIVVKAAGAHCGQAQDGSRNTLQDLVGLQASFGGEPVRLHAIAAVIRFADELAEGKQRTSGFMLKEGRFDDASEVFHQYAKMTRIDIEPGNERIALTYDIRIGDRAGVNFGPQEERTFRRLFDFTYQRIIKLDQERKYARFYCDMLSPFKKTTVAFNFWIAGELQDLGLPRVDLTDLVIPGDRQKLFTAYNSQYGLDNVVARIKNQVSRETDNDRLR